MNLQERQSLPKLWLYSFTVIFQNIGKFLLLGLIVVFSFMASGWFLAPIRGAVVAHQIMQALLGWVVWGVILWVAVAVQRIAAFYTQNNPLSFGKALAGSIAPCLFQIVLCIFYAILAGIFGGISFFLPPTIYVFLLAVLFLGIVFLVTDCFSATTRFILMVGTLLFFSVTKIHSVPLLITLGIVWTLYSLFIYLLLWARCIYIFPAIAAQEKGPFEAISYSWEMTRENVWDAVVARLLYALPLLLWLVLVAGTVYALYVNIPLHYADSFDLFNLSAGWKVFLKTFSLGSIILLYAAFLVPIVFQTLVLINRSTTMGFVRPAQPQPAFSPFPPTVQADVEMPDLKPSAVPETYLEEGLPPDTERMSAAQVASQETQQEVQQAASPAPQAFANNPEITGMMPLGAVSDVPEQKTVPSPAAAPSVQPKPAQQTPVVPQETLNDLQDIGLMQSSVNTSTEYSREIDQHLEKVYTPSADALAQAGDEDRLPTILFDEDIEKQLRAAESSSGTHPEHADNSQDPGMRKLSD